MLRLMLIVYLMAAPTFAGILIIAALVAGLDTQGPILIAAAVGFAGALPVAWIVAKKIAQNG